MPSHSKEPASPARVDRPTLGAGDAAGLQGYLLTLQRAAGNRATTLVVQRTPPFPLFPGSSHPLLLIPEGPPPGPQAANAVERFETLVEGGATEAQLTRAALAETAGLPGGQGVRARLFNHFANRIHQLFSNWMAWPLRGANEAVVFQGNPAGGVGGYGAIIDSAGSVRAGTWSPESVRTANGMVHMETGGWRVIEPGTATPTAPRTTGTQGFRGASPTAAAATEPARVPEAGVEPAGAEGVGARVSAGRMPPGEVPTGLVGPRGGLWRTIRGPLILWVITLVIAHWEQQRARARMREMFERDVDPEARRAMDALAERLDAANEDDPFSPLYVSVSIEVTYRGNLWLGTPLAQSLERARFLHAQISEDLAQSYQQGSIAELPGYALSTTPGFRRTDRFTTSAHTYTDFTYEERLRYAARHAVERGRHASEVVAASWSERQRTDYLDAYVSVSEDRPDLHASARSTWDESQARGRLEARYGTANVAAARAAADRGMSAREASAQTHWRSAAERRAFVAAYVAVTADRPSDTGLNADARAYLEALDGAASGSALEADPRSFEISTP